MRLSALPNLIGFLLLTGMATLATGCSDTTTQPPVTTSDTAKVMSAFSLATTAGNAPLVYGQPATLATGAQIKVSTLRYYISTVSLIDSTGTPVAATLVDSAGKPLKYNLTFCDYAKPETQMIRILARKGNYRGLTFFIGVPATSTTGELLNHADASQATYPLDVDNDMYWGWNPGYVFFKIEGSSMVGSAWQSIVYHVGGDTRFMATGFSTPFAIKNAGEVHGLTANIDRLFITPSGGKVPNVLGSTTDRVVHGGVNADSMAANIASSGFISLKP